MALEKSRRADRRRESSTRIATGSSPPKKAGTHFSTAIAHARVSRIDKLANSLSCTGFPENHNRGTNPNVHFFYQLAMETHGVRRGGSAAISTSPAWPADRPRRILEISPLSPRDLAGGKLLVTEAGGACTTMRGEKHFVNSPDVLADNGLLHDEIIARFAEVYREELHML